MGNMPAGCRLDKTMMTVFRDNSHLAFGLAASILALSLTAAPSRPCPKRPWWEVHFIVTVRGEYSVKEHRSEVDGEYICSASWRGTMERDGSDFLLICLGSEIRDWEIHEKGEAAGQTNKLTEKDNGTNPRLDLYYVLSDGQTLRFIFKIAGPPIPLCRSPEKHVLVLPCSSEDAAEETDYNDSIVKGDNLIRIPESELDKAKVEKTFTWEWKRHQWALRDGGAIALANRHRAEVVVSLTRHSL